MRGPMRFPLFSGRTMHEMSIAQSILQMAEEHMARHGCSRLEKVSVTYGALSGIVPESLQFCFEAMVRDTAHQGARLELVELPLRLRCHACEHVFGGNGQEALWQACPQCGEEFGHTVEQGKECYLNSIEAG